MSTTQSPPRIPLQRLLDEVINARAMLANRRHANGSQALMDDARGQMLATLEAYTTALRDLRLPVPYALRDELRVQRSAYRGSRGRIIRRRA